MYLQNILSQSWATHRRSQTRSRPAPASTPVPPFWAMSSAGGSPTLRDRVNASAMGYQAVCLLEQGKYNRIVGMKGEKLVDYPVDEALEMTKTLDPV